MGNTALLRGIDGRRTRTAGVACGTAHRAVEEIDGDDDVEVAEERGGSARGRTGWFKASCCNVFVQDTFICPHFTFMRNQTVM